MVNYVHKSRINVLFIVYKTFIKQVEKLKNNKNERRIEMESIKLMISEEQQEMFLKEFYKIAMQAIERAEQNAGSTREYLNQKGMSDYLNVSENFLKEAVRNEGLPVATLGRRKFYSKKAVNEFMLKRLKSYR